MGHGHHHRHGQLHERQALRRHADHPGQGEDDGAEDPNDKSDYPDEPAENDEEADAGDFDDFDPQQMVEVLTVTARKLSAMEVHGPSASVHRRPEEGAHAANKATGKGTTFVLPLRGKHRPAARAKASTPREISLRGTTTRATTPTDPFHRPSLWLPSGGGP